MEIAGKELTDQSVSGFLLDPRAQSVRPHTSTGALTYPTQGWRGYSQEYNARGQMSQPLPKGHSSHNQDRLLTLPGA